MLSALPANSFHMRATRFRKPTSGLHDARSVPRPLSSVVTVNPGGILGGSSVLHSGHGIPGAPHLQARGDGPKSDGRRGCASQTQNASSQRAHLSD